MKLSEIILTGIITLALNACGNASSEAEKQAALIKETASGNAPGANATSEDGNYLKVKIDGKLWTAKRMILDESTNSSYFRVTGENNGESISFSLGARDLKTGSKREFRDDNVADLLLNEESGGIYGGSKGFVQITKSDGKWVEGIFQFSATSSMSKNRHEVTEGSFRVPFPVKNTSAMY